MPIDPTLPGDDETEEPDDDRGEPSEDEGEDPSEDEGASAGTVQDSVSLWARSYTRMGGPFIPIGEIVDTGVTWESACATWLAKYGGQAGGHAGAGPNPRLIPSSLYGER